MLPVKHRIPSCFFPVFLKKNKLFLGQNFDLRVHFRSDEEKLDINNPLFRFAFVVNKKTFKRAVDRHLIKRRFHSFFLKNKNSLIDDVDILIQTKKKDILDLKTEDLFFDLEKTLKQAKLFK